MFDLIRRFLSLIATLLLVSILTFLAFAVIPGDPVTLILGTEATPDRVEVLRHQLGLDSPLPARYAAWIGGLVQGNPGTSIRYDAPVGELIAARLPVTAWLAVLSLGFILVLTLPASLLGVLRQGRMSDRILGTLLMLSISVPGFFLGILILWFFGIVLGVFQPGGYVPYDKDFAGFLRYLAFPALAIALPNAAVLVKFLRTSAIGQMKADYVRTARSKGSSEHRLILAHVLRNAVIPVVPLLGMVVAETFAGTILVEQVFGLPGLGRLLTASITSRDFPLVESLVMLIAVVVVVANFMSDVLMQVLDPRIRVR